MAAQSDLRKLTSDSLVTYLLIFCTLYNCLFGLDSWLFLILAGNIFSYVFALQVYFLLYH